MMILHLRRTHLKETLGRNTARVHDALRNALSVKLGQLFNKVIILGIPRSAGEVVSFIQHACWPDSKGTHTKELR